MQFKSIAECSPWSILQYFCASLSYHLSIRSLFCLFLSGRFTQVLLYGNFCLIWSLTSQSTIFQLCRDRSSWVEAVLSKDKCVLLKDTTQVTLANTRRLSLKSSTLPLSHCVPTLDLDQTTQTLPNYHLGDNCIQNFHLGRYIIGYRVGNVVLWQGASWALKPYIWWYTSPKIKFWIWLSPF